MSTLTLLAELKRDLAAAAAACQAAAADREVVFGRWEAFVRDEVARGDLLRSVVWRLTVEQSRNETVYVLKPVPHDPAAARLLELVPDGYAMDVQFAEPALRFNRPGDHHPRVALEFMDVGVLLGFLTRTPLRVRNWADNDLHRRRDRLRRELADVDAVLARMEEVTAASTKPG